MENENDGIACSRCHCESKVELSEEIMKEMFDASTLDKVSSKLATDMLFHWIHQMNPDYTYHDPAAHEKLVLMCRGALAVPGHHWVAAHFTNEMVGEVHSKLWAMWHHLINTWAMPVDEKDPSVRFRFENLMRRKSVCMQTHGVYPHEIWGLRVKAVDTEKGCNVEGQLFIIRNQDEEEVERLKGRGPFDLTVSSYDPQIGKNRSFKILGIEVKEDDEGGAYVSFIAHGLMPWKVDE